MQDTMATTFKGTVQPVPFGVSASYPPRSGNFVRPLVDGIPAFTRIGAAIRDAKARVWIGVSFIDYQSFVFPGFEASGKNDGHFWTLLRRVAERGVDVRLLFWSNTRFFKNSHFPSTSESHEWLKQLHRGEEEQRLDCGILIRWDQSNDAPHCHHEKSFLIDAGQDTEVAFVGGIGMGSGGMVTPEHPPCRPGDQNDHHNHDTFFELQGPSGTDVHHHFVQRWNGALDHHLAGGHWPSLERANSLPFPSKLTPPSEQGNATVQVQRSVRPQSRGGYTDSTPTVLPPDYPGLPTLDIREGEQSIYEQYKLAFGAAKRTIYIENQHVAHPLLLDLLIQALKRGVAVVYMAPALVMRAVSAEYEAYTRWTEAVKRGDTTVPRPRYADVWVRLAELATLENFVLAGLSVANPDRPHGYQIEYVHSRVAIVDGEWFTGGSANLVDLSMEKDHTELNISVWDKPAARRFLADLVHEHSGVDTSGMSDVEMVATLQRVAKANGQALRARKPLTGHAFALDPLTYGSQLKNY